MSIIKANGAGDQDTGFYNGVATQSVRFNGAAEHTTLKRTIGSSGGSRRKAVYSWWMKGELDTGSPYFWSKGTGGGVADILSFGLGNEKIQVLEYVGDSNTMNLTTNRLFRDYNAWYHIVLAFDSTQATASNRLLLYVNGIQETSFATASYVSQNHDHVFGWYQTGNAGSTIERIAAYEGTYYSGDTDGDPNSRFNGYMSEWNHIDGLSFFSDTSGTANTSFNINSFGEFKNGIWIPIKYTGSYGNEGWRLEFKETGVGTASSSTIGADTSGNTNHWTSTGLAAEDCNLPDSPENSFATMNHLVNGYANNMTMREGNLALIPTNVGSSYTVALGNFLMSSGKWYFEATCADWNNYCMVGIARETTDISSSGTAYGQTGVIAYGTQGEVYNESASSSGSYTDFLDQEVIGVAVDMDSSTRTVKFYNNNSLIATFNLSSAFDGLGVVPLVSIGPSLTVKMNFGADSSFSGTKTSGSNEAQDGNGIGDFFYAPPSGYLACCTTNLAEPTLGPNSDNNTTDFFTTTYYAGTNDATRTFDLGFVSDWAWFKADSSGYGHQLYDSSRGVQKYLLSNTTGAEVTNSEGVLDFDDSGNLLKIGTDAFLNESGTSVSLWTWRINGGTTATNSNGSANSTVQVNTTVGMSLVLYTGNSTGSGSEQTIGHGLGAIPDVIMFKSRTYASQNWYIHHKGLANGVTTHVELDTNDLEHGDADYMNEVAPTSSVFSLGHNYTTNKSGESYIAYCFKSVEGYSKYGSFIGNGSTDGTFVYLGFRPQLIIAKCSSHSGSWHMVDATRDYNPIGYYNTDNADAYGDYAHYDILSNGFKVRDNGSESNRDGGTFIYMAWANSPFKYANAR